MKKETQAELRCGDGRTWQVDLSDLEQVADAVCECACGEVYTRVERGGAIPGGLPLSMEQAAIVIVSSHLFAPRPAWDRHARQARQALTEELQAGFEAAPLGLVNVIKVMHARGRGLMNGYKVAEHG
jgi:hypothetical protein